MLVPSIDLRGGRIVQLVQGERVALEEADVFARVRRFARFPLVQLIDLDAALGTGDNRDLVRRIAAELPCRVGGGIRTAGDARAWLDAGAREVIIGSALFRSLEDTKASGRPTKTRRAGEFTKTESPGRPTTTRFTRVNVALAGELARACGAGRIVAAVDSRGGHVVIDGWRTVLPLTPVDAIRALEPYCGGFLYTHVETEGLMRGIDLEAVRRIRGATTRRVSAAGGITTREEVDALDAMGVDAVVGMAIYTGLLPIDMV